jgi:hypothetical protein
MKLKQFGGLTPLLLQDRFREIHTTNTLGSRFPPSPPVPKLIKPQPFSLGLFSCRRHLFIKGQQELRSTAFPM